MYLPDWSIVARDWPLKYQKNPTLEKKQRSSKKTDLDFFFCMGTRNERTEQKDNYLVNEKPVQGMKNDISNKMFLKILNEKTNKTALQHHKM